MKTKKNMWYLGYVIAIALAALLFLGKFNKPIEIALVILFSSILSISHVQITHKKMLSEDKDYKIEVNDERNELIKEKTGNLSNIIMMYMLGIITVVFIVMEYYIPAIITGVILFIQPILLIAISNYYEKRL